MHEIGASAPLAPGGARGPCPPQGATLPLVRLPLPLALLALLLNPAHAWELRGPEGTPTTVQVDAR